MGAAVEEEKHSAEEEDNKLAVQVWLFYPLFSYSAWSIWYWRITFMI
jgi:hypothetical protein